eukprot:12997190-Alexandrium_andersonii.AAC.1
MSASLVGSEMCIRDRSPTLRMAMRLFLAVMRHLMQTYEQEVLQSEATAPVSYTHLTLPTICSV